MSKLRWLSLLMVITILAITGFQVYWLQQNYVREKAALYIKTGAGFRETIQQLQVANLNLGQLAYDSAGGSHLKIFMTDEARPVHINRGTKDNVVSTINVIREKLIDSLNRDTTKAPRRMIINLDKTTLSLNKGNIRNGIPVINRGDDQLVRFLYGVDSLQDSLRIGEIDSAYRATLIRQDLLVPFAIKKTDSADINNRNDLNEVTVGFRNPVKYSVQLGNTLPYLLKKISLPILFSFVLLGITILSFVLLYRSLVKQQQLGELKNEFISNITHELKTPIATVGVAIEALRNFNAMQDPKRTREYLDISSNELQRLGLLVDKVLKLSMFEKKDVELKKERVDLGELVDEVVASLRLQLEKNNASVEIRRTGDLALDADRLHILSVIFNLLDNSIKYSRDNPRIKVELAGDEKDVNITVSDNGIGIPQAYHEKVFEKFFRVPHGDTHNARGYGLGLSYAAQVVQKHRGKIRIEKGEREGTSFIITLPKQIS